MIRQPIVTLVGHVDHGKSSILDSIRETSIIETESGGITLIKYITEGPIIAMVLEGVNTISIVRKIVGSTGPYDASPGTIRGDYAHIAISYANINKKQVRNLIHASADKKDAEREIKLWFSKKELHSYKRADEDHLT